MNLKMLALIAGFGIAATSTSWAAAPQAKLDTQDTQILQRARATSMYLLQLTNIAQEKITDAKVKTFMTNMVSYHTNARNTFTKIAGEKGVKMSDQLNQKRQKKIAAFRNIKVEKQPDEYTRLVIASLSKEIQNLNTDITRATDAQVKSYATRRLTDLKIQMQRVRDLRSGLKLQG